MEHGEPSDRDREMAREACRNWARDGAFIWSEVAKQIALAREEGRREPRPVTEAEVEAAGAILRSDNLGFDRRAIMPETAIKIAGAVLEAAAKARK